MNIFLYILQSSSSKGGKYNLKWPQPSKTISVILFHVGIIGSSSLYRVIMKYMVVITFVLYKEVLCALN